MIRTAAILVVGLTAFGQALAETDCSEPSAPSIPDGSTATETEMVAGQTAIKDYMAVMEEYLGCLDVNANEAQLEEATEEALEAEAERVKLHNAAVDKMEALAAQFNEQVRAFKARQPAS